MYINLCIVEGWLFFDLRVFFEEFSDRSMSFVGGGLVVIWRWVRGGSMKWDKVDIGGRWCIVEFIENG